jgi:hypothetical protein
MEAPTTVGTHAPAGKTGQESGKDNGRQLRRQLAGQTASGSKCIAGPEHCINYTMTSRQTSAMCLAVQRDFIQPNIGPAAANARRYSQDASQHHERVACFLNYISSTNLDIIHLTHLHMSPLITIVHEMYTVSASINMAIIYCIVPIIAHLVRPGLRRLQQSLSSPCC